MVTSFVLIGELKGDYDDYYQRPCEAIATSNSREVLERYRDTMVDHEYVEFRIEGVLNLDIELSSDVMIS